MPELIPGPEDRPGHSSSFDLLHERVRRWIWQQGWEALRDIQERSIPALLAGKQDVIVSAGTASGKTEAAFLPIASRIASSERSPRSGFDAVYVSPLRALINDQFIRMEGLCDEVGLAVTKWHGDASQGARRRALKNPSGVLLITPESLEAMLVRRGADCRRLFKGLGYLVVDEMHAFMDSARGKQLQSILHRLEIAAGGPAVRVGLSATLADELSSRRFLRPLAPDGVLVLSSASSQDIRLQVRGHLEPEREWPARRGAGSARDATPDQVEAAEDSQGADEREQEDGEQEDGEREGEEPDRSAEAGIVAHLFQTMRGSRGLIFAGSRQRVETTTDGLVRLTEAHRVPEEFLAHHGNLSREHREEAERRMKDPSRPASIVCTTTLELGIDVGHIDLVAQLGPGHTVSGMRQRLGRSGRRPGQAAVMRVYVTERPLAAGMHPLDALRRQTVQAVAMLELMLRKWNEPPAPGRLHLSTMVHQVLALVVQHGGLTAEQGWRHLVQSGVFDAVGLDLYKRVLRRMGDPEVALLEQAPDGTLLLGEQGEMVTAGRDFYAVFPSSAELRVVEAGGRSIGTVPDGVPYVVGQFLMLAGRRWRVLEVEAQRKEVVVVAARGGVPPRFGGEAVPPSQGVVQEMRRILERAEQPTFLDATAMQLLTEARQAYRRLGLHGSRVCRHEDRLLLFPWTGPRELNALLLSLTRARLEPELLGLAVAVPVARTVQLKAALASLAEGSYADPVELAGLVELKVLEKYDGYLGAELLDLAYAADRLDVEPLPIMARELLHGWPTSAGYGGDE